MAERAGCHTLRPRLSITTTAAAILAVVAALSFAQRIRAVTHRYNDVDFAFFYGWWTDYSNGGDPWVLSTEHTELRPGLSRPRYCNYSPFFVAVFSPLARLDQKTAFWLWLGVQMLCLVGAVLMLARANAPPLGAAPTIIVLSLVVLSRQFAGALVAAQVTPMLLGSLSASWFCARKERPIAAGLFLALAALLKLYPAAAGGYFLFARRWRALGSAIAFFAAGLLLTNPLRWIELATLEMPVSYGIVGHAELTMLAFVRKCVAHLAGTTTAAAPLLTVLWLTALIDLALLAIAAAATITGRGRADLDGLLFGLWVALALLMSPLAWIPETLLLLPAYLFGMLAVWDGLKPRRAAQATWLTVGAAMLAIGIVTALIKAVPHPGFPVLLAAYLGAALIFWARTKTVSLRDETNRP